jgi:hypothetical protein
LYHRLKAIATLGQKGFTDVRVVNSETEFIKHLDDYDIAWVISSDAVDWNNRSPEGADKWRELATACEKFHRSGRGLFIFADNEPYYDHANVILERLVGAELCGNTPGNRNLSCGNPLEKGRFDAEHLLTVGVPGQFYEGLTICYPRKLGSLKILATSNDGYPAVMYHEHTKTAGRIVVDTGFTKLWLNWYRYVRYETLH